MQIKQAIEQNNPEIKVTGSEYPASKERQLIAWIIGLLQYAFLAIIFAGEQIFNALGLPTERLKKIQENKWMYVMGAFFLGNNIKSAMLQTGAFEIYIDNTLVFSKLQRGRIFEPQELSSLLLENGILLPK
jgi:selT/selW/selH-like putative selenoprotein